MNEDTFHCPECGSVIEEMVKLRENLALAERDLRNKRAQISRLTKQQAEAYPPEYDDAMEIAEYWRDLCMPRARELNGTRLTNTIARLKHYPKSELKLSVWGYAQRPNVRDGRRVREDQGGDRHVDLELIMREARNVDRGIAIAEQEGRCDHCDHPRSTHGLLYRDGHESCSCGCPAYDDTTQATEAWITRRDAEAQRKRDLAAMRPSARKPPPPSQGTLL